MREASVDMNAIIEGSRTRPISPLRHLADDKLVSQAKLGCEQAFVELWNRHRERTRVVVGQIIRNREDAEDVLQETCLKSFLHLVTFNGESQFATWLTRIAINSAFMLLRKRRNHPEVSIENPESDPAVPAMEFPDRSESVESCYFHAERLHQLRHAIQQLPPRLRNVVEFQNSDELPLKEIAHRTGLSVVAVKARLVRARDKLREMTSQARARKSTGRLRRRPADCNHRPLPIA
jgi:RNA polymerase sigma-70 factor, ECF subfamily